MEGTEEAAKEAERLLETFLVRQVEEGLDFESFVAKHPAYEDELRRLVALVPVDLGGADPSSLFYSRVPRRLGDWSSDLSPGRHIAGFQLVRPLGRGGMGEVWEAHQEALDRNVALKFIRADSVTEPYVSRFRTEAKAGGRLNHPNIVSVYDHGQTEGRHWLAQELVANGCTLFDTLARYRENDPRDRDYYRHVAGFVAQIADALGVAHDAGVVHRDIKPQNILITPEDHPKVSDFGLARLLDDAALTQLGPAGTAHYMSPEQVDSKPGEGVELDGRSDVFSLGAVLYELLTLRRAFDGKTRTQVLQRVVNQDPVDPHRLSSSIPADLAVLTMAALEKRREERIPSMGELALELRRFARGEPIRRNPPHPFERVHKWARRKPATAAGVVLAGVLAGVLSYGVPELGRQRGAAVAAERGRLDLGLQLAIERGRMTQAQRLTSEAVALDGTDPVPHLLLAAGLVSYSRFDDARSELDRAIAKGLVAAPSSLADSETLQTAREHLAQALIQLLHHRSRGWEPAAQHLSAAYSLDPELRVALFPLYQTRRAVGDLEGARNAASELARHLPPADPFRRVVDGIVLELDGDFEGALRVLEPLGELAEEERARLRLPRILGRILKHAGRLDDAERELKDHLQRIPDDYQANAFLADIRLLRAAASPTDVDEAMLAEIEAAATAGREWDEHWPLPQAQLVEAALLRLETRPNLYRPASELHLAAFQERLHTLEGLDDSFPLLPDYRARWAFVAALPHFGAGAHEAGIAQLEECLVQDASHFRAACLLAQQLWGRGQDSRALSLLDQAELHYDATRDDGLRWGLAIAAWRVGYADRLGHIEEACTARDTGLERFEDADVQWAEMVTLLEFVATSASERLKDCALVRRSLEAWGLEAFADKPGVAAILEAIGTACDP